MLAIVTATTNKARAMPCIASWRQNAKGLVPQVVVQNGTKSRPYLGVVGAFTRAMDLCRGRHTVEIIACFHDDLVIFDQGWDRHVEQVFADHPEVGLVGFAGATGLGTEALYREDYEPQQLRRIGYRSNLVDAEAHGERSLVAEPVVCVDRFALIGRRAFWDGMTCAAWQTQSQPQVKTRRGPLGGFHIAPSPWDAARAPWSFLEQKGFVNHFYSDALGCLARRLGWQVYYVPVRCRHLGGQTTVEDPNYLAWAEYQLAGGDRGFWEAAHRIGYVEFKDVLPIRLGEPAAACG